MDGVDAALVDFAVEPLRIIATHSEPMPSDLKSELIALCFPGQDEINRFGQLDIKVGQLFANAALALLKKPGVTKTAVCAIGSHGQTIRHQPGLTYPFTLQIGDPNIISELTGITTVADFRRRDMANGGQGAPLVPAFHHAVFRSNATDRTIVNIGGIANVTFLPAGVNLPITGFDTGPGNTLLDAWIKKSLDQDHDEGGHWGKSGAIDQALLETLLADPYLQLPPPKSTGREYFNLAWLKQKLPPAVKPQDVQKTLTVFTAASIMHAIDHYGPAASEMIICGGGIHNQHLLQCLRERRGRHIMHSSAEFGVDPDWVEAVAFAWLAQQTLQGKAGNLPSVTGAKKAVVLGGIYPACAN